MTNISKLYNICNIMKTRTEALSYIKSPIFSRREALEVGLNTYDLGELVKSGTLEREGRGLYRKTDSEISEHESYAKALAHLGEPSAISLWSALAFHDLTEEVPSKIWVYLPLEKYSHLKDLMVVRKTDPKWEVGIEVIEGIRVTNIERTIVEALADGRHFDKFTPVRILLNAIRNKRTTETKLLAMARKLGLDDKVKDSLLIFQDFYV